MRYTPQHQSIHIPFDNPAVRVDLHYLKKATAQDVHNCGPLYILQAARNGILAKLQRGDVGTAKKQWADSLFEEYINNAQGYADSLMQSANITTATSLACVPTTRFAFIKPYHSAAAKACPAALDLSPYLVASADWGSEHTGNLEEKVTHLNFQPPVEAVPGNHILIVDDVISSGKSTAAAILRITRHFPKLHFQISIACGLWIDPTRPVTA